MDGPPHTRGEQYGSQCRHHIGKTIDFYRWMFQHKSKLDWDQSLEKAREFVAPIQDYDPEIMSEIEGIAAGAGRPLEEILAINIRSELLFLLTAGGEAMKACCTSLAATPEATAAGDTFVAQNWDWYVPTRDQCVILKIRQPGRPSIVQLVEAGLIAKIGLNSAGIAMCTNALVCDNWRVGVPFHAILRGILNAASMAEAIGAVTKPRRASAGNYLIAHAGGEAFDIEAGPTDFNVIGARDGLITHANHFQVANPAIRDAIPALWPDSLVRDFRAAKLLKADRPRITGHTIQNLLRDHFDRPYSVCSHPAGKLPPNQEEQTNASVIINVTRKQFYVAPGPPCEHPYGLIDTDDLLGE